MPLLYKHKIVWRNEMRFAVNIIVATVFTAMLLMGGCSILNPQAPSATEPPPAQVQSEKFVEPDVKAPTAVESALIWSEKYTKLTEQMEQVQKKNFDLAEENRTLSNQVTKLQTQLDQAQKELGEANNLLIDMQKELTNWKTDVLGFRDEMRKAQKAQIEALTHIITILGGEVPPQAAADSNAAKSAGSKTNEPNKTK
jgi:septal ring factor EnvC (AmiA/AmiB activator)